MGKLMVSLHDVSPATVDETRRWLDVVRTADMCATLLVVVGPWRHRQMGDDADFVEFLRATAADGHEISFHGWTHEQDMSGAVRPSLPRRAANSLLSRGCAEFAELSEQEAFVRIDRGVRVLRDAGLEIRGFTPPAWLASAGTRRAAIRLGLDYMTSQFEVRDLRRDVRHCVFALSQRPGSSMTNLFGSANEVLGSRAIRSGRSLRLALHPDDLRHDELVIATRALLHRARHQGTTALTYASFIDIPNKVSSFVA